MRVGLSGLTMAEYFRDREHQDVLLFIDNIFRFTQAGSEVSALLGRMPSAVGYQPTLATEMGALQERITSTKNGSITSVQAVYVPADDLTDPAPATTLCPFGCNDGAFARYFVTGHLPPPWTRWNPPAASCHPKWWANSITRLPAKCSAFCSAIKSCKTSLPSWAWKSCRRKISSSWAVPGASNVSCRSRFTVAEQFTGMQGKYVPLAETLRGFKEILEGEHDDLPESAFLFAGTIDEVMEKAKKVAE